MFVRILRSHLRIDKIAAATELFKKSVVPLCRKQSGFKGAYYMSNPKTGENLAMTFWESEEAIKATEESRFFQEQVARFVPFYAEPPVREAYAVILREEMEHPQKLKV
jgi:heme-degrading monooxygenase HmoA